MVTYIKPPKRTRTGVEVCQPIDYVAAPDFTPHLEAPQQSLVWNMIPNGIYRTIEAHIVDIHYKGDD
jgi:hypothetical protein